mmetsp:Transcript_36682/g.95763  ORF Transcript_36682/g.95763 Transcript_36682/m.95763 type:complete len:121 (-) Transcript_36682:359-721(-)
MLCCAPPEPTQAEQVPGPAAEPASAPADEASEITVTLTKTGDQKLGLDISHASGNKALKVKEVKDGGIVREWNLANPGRTIEKGDLIVSINGVKDESDKILKEVVEKSELVIVVKKGASS